MLMMTRQQDCGIADVMLASKVASNKTDRHTAICDGTGHRGALHRKGSDLEAPFEAMDDLLGLDKLLIGWQALELWHSRACICRGPHVDRSTPDNLASDDGLEGSRPSHESSIKRAVERKLTLSTF